MRRERKVIEMKVKEWMGRQRKRKDGKRRKGNDKMKRKRKGIEMKVKERMRREMKGMGRERKRNERERK